MAATRQHAAVRLRLLHWSRDSAYVYFDVTWSGGNGYFRLRISDARLEKLADLKKIRRFPDQFDWTWSGLGPNDTPMFVHDIITQEIYALDLELP